MPDEQVVARQLGRAPRGEWRVVSRCSFGYPVVIATAPLTEAGEPFPTLFYLTCPHLVTGIAALESAGEIERWREDAQADAALRQRLLEADVAYRQARATEGGGADPIPGVGIAGMRDVLAIKCLHAHAAAALAGIDDPVGAAVLADLVRECTDAQCGEGT